MSDTGRSRPIKVSTLHIAIGARWARRAQGGHGGGNQRSTGQYAARAVWCCTACFGVYLLAVWLSRGGLRQQSTRITVFPAVLIFAHPGLATTGLSFWLAYILTNPISLGVLSGSAMLGFLMLTRWLVGRGGRHARGAEQHVPAVVVVVHGAAGLTTFALVVAALPLAARPR